MQESLERLVCAEHCRYYKPWATPETGCGSRTILAAILGANGGRLEAMERLRGDRVALPLSQDSTLLRLVCAHCEHYPDNCAFRRAKRSATAEPCGGLMVLERLLNNGQLTPEELLRAQVSPEINNH